MHISSDEVFEDSEETIHSAEINDTSYESQADFHWEITKKNLKNRITKIQKKCHFPAPPIFNIFSRKFQGLVLWYVYSS